MATKNKISLQEIKKEQSVQDNYLKVKENIGTLADLLNNKEIITSISKVYDSSVLDFLAEIAERMKNFKEKKETITSSEFNIIRDVLKHIGVYNKKVKFSDSKYSFKIYYLSKDGVNSYFFKYGFDNNVEKIIENNGSILEYFQSKKTTKEQKVAFQKAVDKAHKTTTKTKVIETPNKEIDYKELYNMLKEQNETLLKLLKVKAK